MQLLGRQSTAYHTFDRYKDDLLKADLSANGIIEDSELNEIFEVFSSIVDDSVGEVSANVDKYIRWQHCKAIKKARGDDTYCESDPPLSGACLSESRKIISTTYRDPLSSDRPEGIASFGISAVESMKIVDNIFERARVIRDYAAQVRNVRHENAGDPSKIVSDADTYCYSLTYIAKYAVNLKVRRMAVEALRKLAPLPAAIDALMEIPREHYAHHSTPEYPPDTRTCEMVVDALLDIALKYNNPAGANVPDVITAFETLASYSSSHGGEWSQRPTSIQIQLKSIWAIEAMSKKNPAAIKSLGRLAKPVHFGHSYQVSTKKGGLIAIGILERLAKHGSTMAIIALCEAANEYDEYEDFGVVDEEAVQKHNEVRFRKIRHALLQAPLAPLKIAATNNVEGAAGALETIAHLRANKPP